MTRVATWCVLALALSAAACGDDGSAGPETTTTTTSTTTTSTTSTAPTVTTEPPAPVCDPTDVYAAVDDALAMARLAAGGGWAVDATASGFVERTTPGTQFAAELALDCGILATQPEAPADRLLVAAWTGPRMAFVVQAEDQSDPPLALDSIVTIVSEEPVGEYLFADDSVWFADNSVWAGQLAAGETLVAGHVDYNLGVALKTWQAELPRLPDEDPTIDAERYAIAALEASGARQPAVAAEATFGSELGLVTFISPAGQILVAAVAPTGGLDPMIPRYLEGDTTIEQIGGVDVRITSPGERSDAIGAEIGWSCGDWVWVLEPPINGTAPEMRGPVTALIESQDC